MSQDTWAAIASVFGTLAAAFAGSWYAFKLNNDIARKAAAKAEISNANKTLFKLIRQVNVLEVYRLQTLEPHRNSPARHIHVQAARISEHKSDRIDQDSLHFLVERDAPNLLMEILIEDDRFDAILDTIYVRSKFHYDFIQPAIERTGAVTTLADIHRETGPRATVTIKDYTDHLYSMVDASLASLPAVIGKLRAEMKKHYPNEKFLVNQPLDVGDRFETAKSQQPDYSWK